MKGLFDNPVIPPIWPRQYPRFISKISNVDFATMRPSRLRSGGDDQLILEENFHVQIIEGIGLLVGALQSREDDVKSPMAGSIARSRRWLNELISDPAASPESIAKRE